MSPRKGDPQCRGEAHWRRASKLGGVVAASVYEDARQVGMFLEEREQPYVLAVSGKAYVWAGFRQHRVGVVLDSLRQEGWRKWPAATGR